MKTSDKAKWVYTFFLLLVTIGWAAFCVITIRDAVTTPTSTSVLEVAGVTVLLGALIAWNGNVNQYWFRKKPKDEPPPQSGG